MERAFVTGGAGFAGRHLVQRLLAEGAEVMVYDRKVRPSWLNDSCRYEQGNMLDRQHVSRIVQQTHPTIVYHLAALADVRSALIQPFEQVQQNLVATAYLLEAMRAASVGRLAFFSSDVVYGRPTDRAVSETMPLPAQTSVYGAMKLASESLIQAYCEGYHWRADIFRFVSLIGEGYRHGHLIDFYRKLRFDPLSIHIMGNGTQQKFYIYVTDAIDAVQRAVQQAHEGCEIWNVSSGESCAINHSVDAVAAALGAVPVRTDDGTPQGWVGDVSGLVLDCTKIRALGWAPSISVREGIARTVHALLAADAVEATV